MDVHGACVPIEIEPPDVLQQLFTGEHLVGIGGQKVEQLQFLGRQFQLTPIERDGIVGLADGEARVNQLLLRLHR